MNIEQIKNELEQINSDMLALFIRRMELVAELGTQLAAEGKPLYDRKTEEEILEKAVANSPMDMQNYSLELFRAMMVYGKEYYKDKSLYKDFDGLGDYFERFVKRPLRNLMTGSTDRDFEYCVKEKSGDIDE